MKKIALDTNVFRDIDFINFLMENSKNIKVFLPSVVALELGYFRNLKGITWNDFKEYLVKINGEILPWNTINSEEILKNAIEHRKKLPFAHHFRDFIIGTQCISESLDLITYNMEHFYWTSPIKLYNPIDFYSLYKIRR
jgi:predicted nucleic acid-binding protein